MVYFDQILHMLACHHCLTTVMNNSFCMCMYEGLLSSPGGRGQSAKMLKALDLHGIF